jgi:hypothetical protein
MRDKLFSAIGEIIEKHNNEFYRNEEIKNLESSLNATIYTLDALDVRESIDEILDLIGDFFVKGLSLSNKSGGEE